MAFYRLHDTISEARTRQTSETEEFITQLAKYPVRGCPPSQRTQRIRESIIRAYLQGNDLDAIVELAKPDEMINERRFRKMVGDVLDECREELDKVKREKKCDEFKRRPKVGDLWKDGACVARIDDPTATLDRDLNELRKSNAERNTDSK